MKYIRNFGCKICSWSFVEIVSLYLLIQEFMFPRTCTILVLIWRVLLSLWSYWLISIFPGQSFFISYLYLNTASFHLCGICCRMMRITGSWQIQVSVWQTCGRQTVFFLSLFLSLLPPPFLYFLLLIYKFETGLFFQLNSWCRMGWGEST